MSTLSFFLNKRLSAWLSLFVLLGIAASGCNRAYYRRQADRDAYNLVQEKAQHPHWMLKDFSIKMDPRSRNYDPGNPDCPPMPPDDPTAHQLMHCVDGKRGYPGWHDNGDTDHVDNPLWMQFLDFDESGALKLSSTDAVRLGILNSRNYQLQLEEVYLSALDVSFERFRFDAQFFGGFSTFYTADGPQRRNAGGNSRSNLEASLFSKGLRPLAVQKAFTTGGTFVAGVANSVVWQFAGPNDQTATTLVDFTLFQPLMRGAGRDRVMERLTVSERILLNNVRAMEQYRQAFYVEVMTGRSSGDGPNRGGGVFGAGFEGFSGVGGGGFGRVSTTTNNAGSASGGAGAGAAAVGGYMGLLQSQQDIRNQEDNVTRLRTNLFSLDQTLVELRTRRDESSVDSILRQDLQVAQARQALFNAESRLLNSRNQFETNLDNFKNILGVPPTLCLEISDSMLKPFQLVDRGTQQEAVKLYALGERFGKLRQAIVDDERRRNTAAQPRDRYVPRLTMSDTLRKQLAELNGVLEEIRGMRQRMLEQYLPDTNEDMRISFEVRAKRKERLAILKERLEQLKKEKCALLPNAELNAEVFNFERREELFALLTNSLRAAEERIRKPYEDHLNERQGWIRELSERGAELSPEELAKHVFEHVLFPKSDSDTLNRNEMPMMPGQMPRKQPAVRDIVVEFPSDLLVLQLAQASARAEKIELKPVGLKAEQAIAVAKKYRRDLMNARAALVNSWRLIRFNADQLESSLDLIFSGDIQNVGDNPVRLRGNTGRLRVGLQFDSPLTRLSERNTYRQSLIEYQQARRNYMNFEDTLFRGLRTELRTITANELNFELQRVAVLQAARQVDRNEDIRNRDLSKVTDPASQTTGATAARDSVSALNDLLDAQNNFTSIWVNYEAQRRSLDLDLGTMQLDNDGIWIDPGEIGPEYGTFDPWDNWWDEQEKEEGWIEEIEELPPLLRQPSNAPLMTKKLPPGVQPAAKSSDTIATVSASSLPIVIDEPPAKEVPRRTETPRTEPKLFSPQNHSEPSSRPIFPMIESREPPILRSAGGSRVENPLR